MRAPEFAAYIGPAKLYPQLWRLGLGLLLILFCLLGTFAIMLVAIYPVIGPLNYFGWVRGLSQPDTPGKVLFLLGTFFGMALGPVLAAGACHFRGPGTLFGPAGETLRGFFLTVAVLAPLYALALAAGWLIAPPMPNLPLGQWFGWLPLALPLVLLQTTAEELVFRGYLQQQLAARFAARWVWMGLPALIFAALHYNPQAGMNLWLILAATLGFALIAADLTERTGSLGAAMGLHFANNVFAMLVLSVQGTITGLALYLTPYGVGDASLLPLGLALDLGMLFVIWRLLRAVLTR
ncbi:CPBP family intramembrane glutamic endopeptidase [Actibacterium sp. MT2.3-13A]|uniref:CPBP family intramembrane glutamic endopeptidase n=1 Tax=Actibacterium sp. MT2.3-13A TaxID=2828332 RepID=UPI001BAE1BAE|nr:CPBP family intramembrane glutamic endopeptidase [Actibacterium sp. MT2.3-13A]